ncbi:type II secretion system protein GspL [Vibrio paucivorans]|uniref:Type II secretion system protein L n=1 Tax=Vibrio paucivorans TaxID=2829489 RepID=A0A9X3HQL6_9VIBR|nr:type II secretion system protein GspL [Vibrio paucivorans]MCW8333343.1 type II secretion system protein GspL [Vibrio paucivorans]
MSEFLIVRLSCDKDATIQWLVWSTSQNEVIASGDIACWENLPELAEYAQQRTVHLLVSADDVILSQVVIPAGGARQLDSMLPFLMEDDIAQDVDELHFSVLEKGAEHAFVCALDKQWLSDTLAELKSFGVEVKKVLPDVLALPSYSDADQRSGISSAQINDKWLMKKGQYLGVSIDSDWLQVLAASEWVKQDDVFLPLSSHSPLPSLELASEQEWQELPPQLVMALLAQGAISSKVNLLTGSFKPRSSWLRHWKVWQKAAMAAVFLIAVSTTYNILQISKFESQANAYRAESERIFREALPGKTRIPTVSYLKRQMESEANRLSGGGSGGSMLEWVAKLPQSLGVVNTMQLQSIKYDGNRDEMRIQAQSKDFQSFEQVRVKLAEQFEVEQGQLNRSGEWVNGTYVLKRQ